MTRHFEYTDQDGKRWAAMQNAEGCPRTRANQMIAHMARVNGWRDIEVFPATMPEWEVKRRINAVQARNNNPAIYPEEECTDPALLPVSALITTSLIDHHDKSSIEISIKPTSAAVPMMEPIAGSAAAGPAVMDHQEVAK